MIETVKARQRGALDFEGHYDNLCALQDTVPLPAVKAHLHEGVLDINGDRVRSNDWMPLLNSLRINKTLEFVAVRSYFEYPVDENGEINDKKAYIYKKKTPAIRSKEISYRLCKALRECLAVTPALACIELQGLQLRERDLTYLAKGLLKNATVNHFSLEYCKIGDAGLEIVCKGIKNATRIASVNFSGCGLTWKGAELLAKIVKHQAMKRHNEAWRDSLRYRRPDLDQMAGLRRITINHNPLLNDQGAMAFAEALKDDLWLKALDMQHCGLGTTGAKALLDALKFNTTIVVLDVRANPLIDRSVMQSIMEQVMINCGGQDTEYKWIRSEAPKDPMKVVMSKVKKRRTKTLNSSFGRRTTIKVSGVANGRKRAKTTPGRALGEQQKKSGLPWRTALRATRYKGYPPEHTPGMTSITEMSELTTPPPTPAVSIRTEPLTTSPGEDEETEDEDTDEADPGLDLQAVREMKVELEMIKRQLEEEKMARKEAEEKNLELKVENERLKHEMASGQTTRNRILDDDRVLESIEASFQHFHSFLDMLRDAGLGELITVAGINQSAMPFGRLPPGPRSRSRGHPEPSSWRARYEEEVRKYAPPSTDAPPTKEPPQNMDAPPMSDTLGLSEPGFIASSSHGPTFGTTAPAEVFDATDEHGNFHPDPMVIDSHTPMLDVPGSRLHVETTPTIHLRPDNYQQTQDPTMQATQMMEESALPPKQDDLYQRVIRETTGVLTNIGEDSSFMTPKPIVVQKQDMGLPPPKAAPRKKSLNSEHGDAKDDKVRSHSGSESDSQQLSKGSSRSYLSKHSDQYYSDHSIRSKHSDQSVRSGMATSSPHPVSDRSSPEQRHLEESLPMSPIKSPEISGPPSEVESDHSEHYSYEESKTASEVADESHDISIPSPSPPPAEVVSEEDF